MFTQSCTYSKAMKNGFAIILLLFASGTAYAYSPSDFDSIPSESFKKELRTSSIPPEELLRLAITDTEIREMLFTGAWLTATQSSPVDNRAYLYSLAVDLYNSLGPETNECPPDAFVDENGEETADAEEGCGKYRLWRNYSLGFNEDPQQIDYYKKQGSLGYSRYFMLLNYPFGGPQSAATIQPAELNLTNPTPYQPLLRWMAQTMTAQSQGVQAWEAVTWTTEHCGAWGGCDRLHFTEKMLPVKEASPPNPVPVTNVKSERIDATHPPGSQPSTKESVPRQAVSRPDEPERNKDWLLWVIIGLIVLVVGGRILLGGRR